MRYVKILLLMMILLAATASADYRWSLPFEVCDSFELWWMFGGDSTLVYKAYDTGSAGNHITSASYNFNTDSMGFGIHLFTHKYFYDGANQWVGASDPYNNSRGEGDGRALARIYSYDTTGAALVSGVEVTIYTSTGQFQQMKTTVNGYIDFFLAQSGTYIAYGSNPPGCPFDTTHFTVDTGVSGTSIDTIFAACYAMPAPAGGVNYVAAYIDVGTNEIDTTGSIVTRDNMTANAILVGEQGMRIDTTWQIIPSVYTAKSNGSGRYMFRLPANTVITPAGSYYSIHFTDKRGKTVSSLVIPPFYVDTLVDPLNILTATQVAP